MPEQENKTELRQQKHDLTTHIFTFVPTDFYRCACGWKQEILLF